ncbi:MAG: hypothetical protein HOV80_35600 [Polyangiaceae bacterium]|nr:hypothetical protein [Polyangiaceae bacterium]
MGDSPNPSLRHESSAESSRGELARALDRAEHRRLEQRILSDRALEEAARRPTDAGLGIEILQDVPPETSATRSDPRKPLWIVLAAASVIAPCALVIVLNRATAEAPVAASPVAALPNRQPEPELDLPEPPPIQVVPVATTASAEVEAPVAPTDPKPRAPARPKPSATNDVAPNGDKPLFELKR